MARRVFISFRYSDGHAYKEELECIFDADTTIINCSENKDRSDLSEESIKKYLYDKLRTTSVTIVIITPEAITHHRRWNGNGFDDWMYDEIRYSLEDRENNRCNGLVAVYSKEAEPYIFSRSTHKCEVCQKESTVLSMKSFDNLCIANMMNVYSNYKTNKCSGIYDGDEDSYCSFVAWDDFISDYKKYIDKAAEKRESTFKYDIKKRLN